MFVSVTSTGAVAIRGFHFGTGNKRPVYSYSCSGSESSLGACNNYMNNDQADRWYNNRRAAVECQQKGVNLTSEDTVNLHNGNKIIIITMHI